MADSISSHDSSHNNFPAIGGALRMIANNRDARGHDQATGYIRRRDRGNCHALFGYRAYSHVFGAEIIVGEFFELFVKRQQDAKVKIPRAMADAFAQSSG